MKISILTDISVTQFYEHIRIYQEILLDILTQNIDENKIDKKTHKYVEKNSINVKK